MNREAEHKLNWAVNKLSGTFRDNLAAEQKKNWATTKMDWVTIYITGKEGFKPEVARKLDHSDLDFMPGYVGSGTGSSDHDMYWVNSNVDLRQLKLAIGAKTIWKYRIKVYQSLEAFVASQNHESTTLTDNDLALIQEMRKTPYLRSA